ncbi:MAG: isoleucine--tRNA ligase [Alphaproteobacteria bacterium]|nr:isoleucine--tRNA ligase [Alphaproteobacteria bacterium]
MTIDYKSTIFLPKTDFLMKAGLPKQEPLLLARWEKIRLWARLRSDAKGREKFILHDGPPYANGHIHIGTALNKILKDIVNRSQQMIGKDANYVPGWDCHGLPIEWQIEQAYRDAGRNKDDVPKGEFRRECREFANKWIDIQRAEFVRLGVTGDWGHPYTTMDYAAEAAIVVEICKFLMNGSLYHGAKPVMWSVVEKTALAEAEIEYMDHTSTTVTVRFPVVSAGGPAAGAVILIWTTTPWTIPGNRAIAVKPDAVYVRIRVTATAEKSTAIVGDEVIVAKTLLGAVCAEAKVTAHEAVAEITGGALAGLICAHPLRGQGYDFDVRVFPADFVDLEQGTGFVHIAPGHGEDDFILGQKNGIEAARTVSDDGTYYAEVPLFAGKHVFKVDNDVAESIRAAGCLFARAKVRHSYPHSWRSKAPLIFRTTPQWFISMEKNGLRSKALDAIDRVRWLPVSGRNRIHGMIKDRPEWVISRQRAWGVPITVFVNKETGEVLRDSKVNERIAAAVRVGGADVWFQSDGADFLGSGYDIADFKKVDDIVDVWFDSGSTHAFVLEARSELEWPASLYLEGSDQHRGWFHSSLLEACGTRGTAPYKAVLTHGFVLDGEGRKMSKSLGNTVAPQQIVDQHGAEILRLWVANSDYTDDLRIGPEIVQGHVDSYRKLRNTFRYLLSNLTGFDESERVTHGAMPELERWVHHRLAELDVLVRRCVADFDFHTLFVALYNFCAVDLSALYFDIRKDSLYCDAKSAPRRRSARTLLDETFSALTAWLAPVLCFTTEEVWLARFNSENDSVHLRQFPRIPAEWRDPALAAKWDQIWQVRRVVTGALEAERQAKRIGSSLQAHPIVYVGAEIERVLAGVDLAEIAITSGVTVTVGPAPTGAFSLAEVPDVGVVPGLAGGQKCVRCWQVLPDVGDDSRYPGVCGRCAEAVAQYGT